MFVRELSYVFSILSEVDFKAQVPETAFGSTFETANFLCSGPRQSHVGKYHLLT